MDRKYVLIVAVVALLAAIVVSQVVISGQPPSVDLFVEDWSVLPSAFNHVAMDSPPIMARVESLVQRRQFPQEMTVYLANFTDPEFLVNVARAWGFSGEYKVRHFNGYDRYIFDNNYSVLRVLSYGEIEYMRWGYSPPMAGGNPGVGPSVMKDMAVEWLFRAGLYSNKTVEKSGKGYVVSFFMLLDGVKLRYAVVHILDGQIVYTLVRPVPAFLRPYKTFRLKSYDRAYRIFVGCLRIGGVISRARGYTRDMGYVSNCIFGGIKGMPQKIIVNDVELTYILSHDGYLIPIYVFSGVDSNGGKWEAKVDAVDRT